MKRSSLKTKPKVGAYVQEGKSRVKYVDPRRNKKAERFARQFHSEGFLAYTHKQPCWTCLETQPELHFWWHPSMKFESEASHMRSRGAGGTWRDVIPQCKACHSEFHQKGRLSFCQARGWPPERLSELAAGYAREWEAISQP